MYMGNKKFEEEKKLYMLLKEERYSDAWLELETLFLNNKEINQKENIILRLSYYFYIAMNEEYSEMNISYMDFYKEFPEIRTGMSEKELAGKVLDALKKTAQIQKRKEEGQVHPVIYSIKKDIRDNASEMKLLKEYAGMYHINSTYLSELFVKETGKTFSDIVIEIKMEKAKKMLKEPNSRVYEVAVNLGYSDGRYFSQIFKRYTGISPKEFQKSPE